MFRRFPGKILLFGEYTIIAGSKALVLPLRRFSGSFEMPGVNQHADILKSNEDLRGILEYLVRLQGEGKLLVEIDTGDFQERLESGLFFNSTIPSGYGAGSSGALVAAIFDAFGHGWTGDGPHDLAELRNILGQIESHYHGTSSGIDPLCSYLDTPVLLNGNLIRPVKVPSPPTGSGFFLLDSGRSGETGPLVDYFNLRLKESAFLETIKVEMIPVVERCIECFLEKDPGLQKNMASVSALQYANFQQMIATEMLDAWAYGLDSGSYSLKLCGSGGGGYIIAYSTELETAREQLKSYGVKLLSLES